MPKTSAQAVMDDHGEIGDGATHAHHVSAENGEEFIIKGRSFIPEHPTVAANEWIAANLAEALGLPILPSQLLTMNDELFFGSSWMTRGSTWHPQIDRGLFKRCENQDRAYDPGRSRYVAYQPGPTRPQPHRACRRGQASFCDAQ
jgi:hypothetical protein